jgi:hypothetical protein
LHFLPDENVKFLKVVKSALTLFLKTNLFVNFFSLSCLTFSNILSVL